MAVGSAHDLKACDFSPCWIQVEDNPAKPDDEQIYFLKVNAKNGYFQNVINFFIRYLLVASATWCGPWTTRTTCTSARLYFRISHLALAGCTSQVCKQSISRWARLQCGLWRQREKCTAVAESTMSILQATAGRNCPAALPILQVKNTQIVKQYWMLNFFFYSVCRWQHFGHWPRQQDHCAQSKSLHVYWGAETQHRKWLGAGVTVGLVDIIRIFATIQLCSFCQFFISFYSSTHTHTTDASNLCQKQYLTQ